MSDHPLIICLMGPTGAGKTQLAVDLVARFPFEIISVDSAMIYRGMDIGTAKPTPDILRIAPHRLIDILDPAESYSVAQFRCDALREIEMIHAAHKIPLLVGGTMMYFRALQKGLSELPEADSAIRLAIQEQADLIGWQQLHEKLTRIDPEAASRIHAHDRQRIQRALEVYEMSGKTMTEWQTPSLDHTEKYQMLNIIIAPENRALLHERIAKRFDEMLQQGFIDEVKQFFGRPDLNLDKPSMRSVGYRQVWEYLLGHFTYDEMRERSIFATRQLAKRQLTWLRSWADAHWFDSDSKDLLDRIQNVLR